jgi:DNA-binding transcriptional ArsR family regulator
LVIFSSVNSLEALGDPVRRRIVELIGAGEMAAGEVTDQVIEEFAITQPAVSRHLRVLRESGLASARASGTRRLYRVEAEPLRELEAWLDGLGRFWDQGLGALDTEVRRGIRVRKERA